MVSCAFSYIELIVRTCRKSQAGEVGDKALSISGKLLHSRQSCRVEWGPQGESAPMTRYIYSGALLLIQAYLVLEFSLDITLKY